MAAFDPHPEHRVALVTGASSGIGTATALALAAAGHPVALGARRVERCEETVARIERSGGTAVALHLDLQEPASVEAFVKTAEAALGPAEVLVAAAGLAQPAYAVSMGPAAFANHLQVNLVSAQQLMELLVPGMAERRRGDVVVVSSDVVVAPRPLMSAYVAAKCGLEGLARTLQMELEGTGVRISIVRPGPTATEMGSDWEPDLVGAAIEEWERWGLARHSQVMHPDAVASAIMAVVGIPRGAHLRLVEIHPEAPVRPAAAAPGPAPGPAAGPAAGPAPATGPAAARPTGSPNEEAHP